MPIVTTADLGYLRSVQRASMTDTAIVEHREEMDDGMGGSTSVTTGYTPDLPCRVSPLRVQAGEQLVGGQLQSQLPWHVTLPAETMVDVSDRIHVGGALTGTSPNEHVTGGRVWEVLAIYAAHTVESARQCLAVARGSAQASSGALDFRFGSQSGLLSIF